MVTDKNLANLSDEEIIRKLSTEYEKKEKQKLVEEYNFPTEVIQLPSQGLVYKEDSFLRKGKATMKYMTAVEEDILTSQNLIRQGIVLDKLLQTLIVDPIDYLELIPGDKNALLISARVLGLGKEYKKKVFCPACGEENIISIDLTSFKPKPLDPLLEKASNRFEVSLPHSNRKVVVKLINGYDQERIKELVNKEPDKEIDHTPSITLQESIVEVDGNSDRKFISDFVKYELFSLDAQEIRKFLDKITPDVDRTAQFKCKNSACNHTQDFTVAIGIDFFWPGA